MLGLLILAHERRVGESWKRRGGRQSTSRASAPLAFTLVACAVRIGGIIYASRLRSMSPSFDGGTIAL